VNFFAIAGCDTHFKSKLRRNGQPAYEVFSIKHEFYQFKSQVLGLKRPGRQKGVRL